MRFLLLNQFYPPDVAPTGHFLHDVARELVARGHDVRVLSSRQFYEGGSQYGSEEIREGVRVIRVPSFGFGRTTVVGKLADYGSYMGSLIYAFLSNIPRPDVIVALTSPPYIGLVATLASRFLDSAVAQWVMDVYPDILVASGFLKAQSRTMRLLELLARMQLRQSAHVLCLGPYMAEKLRQNKGIQSALSWVPLWGAEGLSPWPEAEPNQIRSSFGWQPGETILMYSGNMGQGHRFAEFLQAAERLSSAKVRWVFGGGGKRRKEVEAFAKQHPNLPLHILDYSSQGQLRERLCAADVHLVSLESGWDGLMVPSKIQSIFSVGKPAIFVGGRNNDVADWIAKSGGGWTVCEGDTGKLVDAVIEASDPIKRALRGRAAYEFAQAQFDRERNIERVADIFESCRRDA